MKRFALHLLIIAMLAISLAPALGGPSLKSIVPTSREADKLLKEGDSFREHGQLSGALWAYRQAAKAGSAAGAFAAGDLLLEQGRAARGRERILQLAEGLDDLFCAATNHDARACAELSDALENGVGVETNLVAAYAWMKLAADWDAAFKPQLDRLVVLLDPGQIRQAQDWERGYARGRWPANLVHPVDQGDPRLKLQGVSNNGRKSLVIVNDVTLAPGDTADVTPIGHSGVRGEKLSITCRKIGEDYVLLSIAGETHWKLLSTAPLQ